MRSILALILIAVVSCTVSCIRDSNSKYPYMSGTYESFADGRFVIAHAGWSFGGEITYKLYDQEYKDRLIGHWLMESDIINYKEVSPYLYVIGKEGGIRTYFDEDAQKIWDGKAIFYTLVNLSTGEAREAIDINEFDEKDREIFNELVNSESVFDK